MKKPISLNVGITGPLLYQEAMLALLTGLPGIVNCDEVDGTPDVFLVIFTDSEELEDLSDNINQHPSCPVLLLSTSWTPMVAIQAIRVGAVGCLSADISPSDLATALRQAARGEMVLSPKVQRAIVLELARSSQSALPLSIDSLSDREREVLTLLVEGMSNKQIAQHLYLSVRTVENHLRRLYQKLGVSTRTEAAVLALQERWVEGLGDST